MEFDKQRKTREAQKKEEEQKQNELEERIENILYNQGYDTGPLEEYQEHI
jgi:hypothetical protein